MMDARAFESRTVRWALLAVVSIAYLAGATALALQRPVWNDELYTLYIADSPTMSDVWGALATGADQVPPPFHRLIRASMAIFGSNLFAVRFPAVVAFWLMGICLHFFVARRVSSIYGAVAMSFPLLTGVYDYAHEGRSYALVLCFGACALLSWQATADDSRRLCALIGLGLSVAAAVCSHYYAVLLVIPLALAELARSLERRQFRLGVAVALAVGLVPLLYFLPLIVAARSYSVSFWARADPKLAAIFYFYFLIPTGPALCAAFALAAAYSSPRIAELDLPPKQMAPGFAPGELAALLAFALVPVVAVLIGIFVTGVFTPRYALIAVIGLAGLVGFGGHWAFAGRRRAGILLVVIFLGWFAVLEGRALNTSQQTARRGLDCANLLRNADATLPIAVSDPLTFLKLTYELPPDLSKRLVYLADPAASLAHLGHNTVDRGLLDLEPWFSVRVEPLRTFLEATPEFLVLARTSDSHGEIWKMGWLLAELVQTDARMELVGRSTDDLLFRVTR